MQNNDQQQKQIQEFQAVNNKQILEIENINNMNKTLTKQLRVSQAETNENKQNNEQLSIQNTELQNKLDESSKSLQSLSTKYNKHLHKSQSESLLQKNHYRNRIY